MKDPIQTDDLLRYFNKDGTESAFQRAMRKWRETERETKNTTNKIKVSEQLTKDILQNVDEIIKKFGQYKTSPDSSKTYFDSNKFETKKYSSDGLFIRHGFTLYNNEYFYLDIEKYASYISEKKVHDEFDKKNSPANVGSVNGSTINQQLKNNNDMNNNGKNNTENLTLSAELNRAANETEVVIVSKQAMAAAIKERADLAAARAKDEASYALGVADRAVEREVSKLREIRKAEKEQSSRLAAVDKARKQLKETGNISKFKETMRQLGFGSF